MSVTLKTPSQVRAHLLSLRTGLESLHSSIEALLQALTAGIQVWIEQNSIMVSVMERFGVENFSYPTSQPECSHPILNPRFSSSLHDMYFTPARYRKLIQGELCEPLVKVIEKVKKWTEEFESCFASHRKQQQQQQLQQQQFTTDISESGSQQSSTPLEQQASADSGSGQETSINAEKVDGGGSLRLLPLVEATGNGGKQRKQRILYHIQRLDGELSRWLGKFVPKLFSTLSVTFGFSAHQFDGKVFPSSSSSTSKVTNASPNRSSRASFPTPPSPRDPNSSSVNNARCKHVLSSSKCIESVVSSPHETLPDVLTDSLERGGGVTFPPVSVETSFVGSLVPLPPIYTVPAKGDAGGDISTQPMTVSLSSFQAGSSVTSSRSFGSMKRAISSREWGGDAYDKSSMIQKLEDHVEMGRVAFDNSISLAFALARSLEKLLGSIFSNEKNLRALSKVVHNSFFSLETFVYKDYSELQAMLPINFIKILRQLDDHSPRNRKQPMNDTPRTAFPVRRIKKGGGGMSAGGRSWLDRSINTSEVIGKDMVKTELSLNPWRSAVIDRDILDTQRHLLLQSDDAGRSSPARSRSGSCSASLPQAHHAEFIQMSPEEQNKLRLCEYVRVFNVLVCGYFHQLSQVYRVPGG